MTNKLALGLALATSALVAACGGDGSTAILANNGSVAFVRFINAIPDSGGQDWRFVDQVEGSPTTFNLTFRGIFPGAAYQQAVVGTRHLRVFQSAFDQSYGDPTQASPDIVSTVFVDTSFVLAEGHHYSLIAVGSLKAKTAKLLITDDAFPDPGGSVAVRVVNLGVAPTIDVYASPTGGSAALACGAGLGARAVHALEFLPDVDGSAHLARQRRWSDGGTDDGRCGCSCRRRCGQSEQLHSDGREHDRRQCLHGVHLSAGDGGNPWRPRRCGNLPDEMRDGGSRLRGR